MKKKSAIGVHHTSTSDASWDGPANERNVRSGEEAGYYRRIYAWRDAEAAGDRKAHYRFIHHHVAAGGDPGAASIVACRTGIGVLNGARGGTTIPDADRQGVYNHLAAHLRDADEEPPELRTVDDLDEPTERRQTAEGQILRRMLPGEFRRACGEGRSPEPGTVWVPKTLVAEMSPSGEQSGLYSFVISSASVDRDDDTIAVNGWDFKNYMRNPVVLWAHQHRTLPIGRARDISVDGGKVKALTEFVPADLYPFADQVRRFYEAGFLRAVSVGFIPQEWEWAKDEDGRPHGIDFLRQELLEFSAVPVPSNPDALLEEAKGANWVSEEIKFWKQFQKDSTFPPDADCRRGTSVASLRRRLRLETERNL